MIAIVIVVFLVALVSCAPLNTVEPTPRPTYTPYPTYTPEPTATPRPTYTPYPAAQTTQTQPNSITSTPVANENLAVHETEVKEWFFGAARVAYEKGREMFESGQYEAAINASQEAQQHRNKPSAVLENWIALSYDSLGKFDLAIQHHSYAISNHWC